MSSQLSSPLSTKLDFLSDFTFKPLHQMQEPYMRTLIQRCRHVDGDFPDSREAPWTFSPDLFFGGGQIPGRVPLLLRNF